MLALVLGILVLGFAIADNDYGMQDRERDGTGEYHDDVIAAGGMNGEPNQITTQQREEIRERIREGEYEFEGQRVRIEYESEREGDRIKEKIKIRVRNVSADTELEIEEERENSESSFRAKLSNGQNAEIKIMPDVASETALARLRIRNCNVSNNCTIELKEVGEGNMTRAAYEIRAEKRARLFGFIPADLPVESQIDAETGEVIRERRPWWSFLASEQDETEEVQE